MPVVNPKGLIEDRVKAIRDYHGSIGLSRAELDVSGGVDSGVMLGLLAKALGPENITAVYMGIDSSPESHDRAKDVADTFGVKLIDIDLTKWFDVVVANMRYAAALAVDPYGGAKQDQVLAEIRARCDADPTILGSLRSCIRAPIGRGFNRMLGNGIRHGTGNEDEDRWLRFYNKGGDGEVDTNPLGFLSKGEVFQLALALGVPKSILEARPSPDLWGCNTDTWPNNRRAHYDEDEIRSYLHLPDDFPYAMYSYVDMTTGQYKSVGLIERINRWLDESSSLGINEERLFDDVKGIPKSALESPRFRGIDPATLGLLLGTVRKIERTTRHKENPNIPFLGSRGTLVYKGILTDDLPV